MTTPLLPQTVDGLNLDRFPVAEQGKPTFSDDFGAPRGGGTRRHQGIDIFAVRGTPVLAVKAGKARNSVETNGGRVVYLTDADGARFYYAHLDNWRRIAEPNQLYDVRSGEVLGFVGDTGNAQGTPPHLHFQMAEKDQQPVNPFPYLDSVKGTALVAPPPDVESSSSSARETRSRTAAIASPAGGGLGLLLFLWLAFGKKGRRGYG